ncbi:MAG: anaerobic ribonucleoside-triphosphate reductase activating protein [Muribaculaceae bacterium]|nr:anaerobic ribonucleoside-triphosphate reductase activating protein [Muribaculaceae bacterium]
MNYLDYISEQELNKKVSVLDIIEGTSVDGPGLRTSIYFAGCTHHCAACHNPQSWDINNGNSKTIKELLEIIEYNDFDVTFSGGDPFFQLDAVIILARAIKSILGKTIWCYTGYTIEEIRDNDRLALLLNWIDVLVDGPFILEKKDPTLLFRGSSNQSIIHLHE